MGTRARTEVYWNLHKKLFSIREGGRVMAYGSSVLIHDPKFVIQKAGQRRVRKTKRKNVHAFVTTVSDWVNDISHAATFGWPRVSYNPYEDDTFMEHSGYYICEMAPGATPEETKSPIEQASMAWLYIDKNNKPVIEVLH